MIFFLLIVIAVAFSSAQLSPQKSFYCENLSKENTNAINGLFVMFVFLNHSVGYTLLPENTVNNLFFSFSKYLGQLIVTPFFFFSGYGIIKSIIKKGDVYVNSIPKRRFLRVLVHFDIAVLLFAVLNVILKIKTKPLEILLSLTGWTNIGNSNWYILAVLALYIIVFVSFKLSKNKYVSLLLTFVFAGLFICMLFYAKKPCYYYNTCLCYPLGMAYGILEKNINRIVTKNVEAYLFFTGALLSAFAVIKIYEPSSVAFHSIWAATFVLCIVVISKKIRLKSEILNFFGKHIFSFYILQRIPMIILNKIGFSKSNPYVFVLVCFFVTACMVIPFDRMMQKIDEKLNLN